MRVVTLLAANVQDAAVRRGGITVRLKATKAVPTIRFVPRHRGNCEALYRVRWRDIAPPPVTSLGGVGPCDGDVAGLRGQLPGSRSSSSDGAMGDDHLPIHHQRRLG